MSHSHMSGSVSKHFTCFDFEILKTILGCFLPETAYFVEFSWDCGCRSWEVQESGIRIWSVSVYYITPSRMAKGKSA